MNETTKELDNTTQPYSYQTHPHRDNDHEGHIASAPDQFSPSESINEKHDNTNRIDGRDQVDSHPPHSLRYQGHSRPTYVPVFEENSVSSNISRTRRSERAPRHRVEWIYPDGSPSVNNSVASVRLNDLPDNESQIHRVNPSHITISPSVVDGVIVQNKRCFLKICGIELCDDSFPCAINPKLIPFLIAFIIILVAVSTIISIYITQPSQNDLNDLFLESVDLNPSLTPTNEALIAPSLNPSMTLSMSPSYQCIVKYPYLNDSLIGNGICDGGKYLDEDCGYDGGDCIPSLDSVGKSYGGRRRWSFVLGPDGNIYGIPYDAESILKFDPSSHETDLVGKDLGNISWKAAVLGNDGMIYGIPSYSKRILKYDPILNSISFIAEGNELLTGDDMFYGGVVAKNDNIYFIPYDHNKVLIYNSSNIENPLVEIGDDLGWNGDKFRNGVLGQDGNIYGIPYNADKVLKISVSDDTVSFIGNNLIGKNKFSNGVLAKNGNIYACPHSELRVLRINTTDETVNFVGPTLGLSISKWSGFVESPDGLLYGIPYNSDDLLMFDPDMETATMIPLDEKFVGTFFKWNSGVLGDNGIIYVSPYYSANILAITSNSKGK